MNKVFLTGIGGQDASFLADYILANTDHEIYALARATKNPNDKNYKHLLISPRFHILYGDVTNAHSISYYIAKYEPDYFFNFAAQSNPSLNDPILTYTVNAEGVLNCLEAIRLYQPKCRFFNAGSSEENVVKNMYGFSKSAAYDLVDYYRLNHNIWAIHSILYTHTSERQNEEFISRKITKGIARINQALKKGEDFAPIELGNLENLRPFAFAGDFVEGMWKMMNLDTPFDFILHGKKNYTIRQFVEEAFKNFCSIQKIDNGGAVPILDSNGRQIQYTYSNLIIKNKPIVVTNPAFYKKDNGYDINIYQSDFGWSPKTSFEQLVKRMVKWDIENYVG